MDYKRTKYDRESIDISIFNAYLIQTLIYLDLSDNQIDNQGAQYLIETLLINHVRSILYEL